jgi:hypothetical protein
MFQTLWMFEVSKRSLGSQPVRVDHLRKKWRARRKKNSRKMGIAQRAQVSTRGRRLDTCACQAVPIFFNILLFKKKEFLEVWEMCQGF